MEAHISVGGDTYRIVFCDQKPGKHDIEADADKGVILCGPAATTALLQSVVEELARRAPRVVPPALIPILGYVQ